MKKSLSFFLFLTVQRYVKNINYQIFYKKYAKKYTILIKNHFFIIENNAFNYLLFSFLYSKNNTLIRKS